MKSAAKGVSFGFICLGLMASPAFSQPQINGSGGDLPVVQGQGTLTISGDGYWHRQALQSGEQPVLSSHGGDGQLLPDGQYRYELRMVPENAISSARQRDVLCGNAPDTFTDKQQPVPTIDGQFEIQGGEVVFP